jgi:putative phosphoesterase
MKIGLMSDSHDNMDALQKAVDLFNNRNVVAVLHAGDLVAPFTACKLNLLNMPLTITFGNNDGEKIGLRKVFSGKIFEPPHQVMVADKRVLMLHDPVQLSAFRDSGHFDLILYGHTHEVEVSSGKTMVVNPGECGGWLNGKCTVAIWDTESGKVAIHDI